VLLRQHLRGENPIFLRRLKEDMRDFRLPREDVVPRVRYRVAQQGWHRVAEPAIEYKMSPGRKE
jgi:hypothetical protein